MLSIGKLGNGAESYYLNTVAKGREEYYTGRGEALGVWLGKGSTILGLQGPVTPSDLRMALAGYSPGEAQRLDAGRVDPKRRVPGFDLTFSAPKSVSLLYGLGSPEVAQKVREAHEEAVSAGIEYLERHATKARRGPGGERRIAADGWVGAAFGHRTSRNGDPQLHTHVLVANVVRGADGAWSAPDARLLYHQAQTAGYLYQAVLRHGLTRSLGVEFEAVRKGSAEIKGIDPVLRRAFSSRRAEIEEHLAIRGDSSSKAAEVAALATRAPKDPALVGDELGLRQRWRKEAIDHGFDPERLRQLAAGPSTPGLTETERRHLLATLASPEGLTAHYSTFTRRQTLRAIAERLPRGAQLAEIETLADRLLKDPRVVAFPAVDQVGELRYSTSELLELEGSMLESAQGRLDKGVSVVQPDRVERALDAAAISPRNKRAWCGASPPPATAYKSLWAEPAPGRPPHWPRSGGPTKRRVTTSPAWPSRHGRLRVSPRVPAFPHIPWPGFATTSTTGIVASGLTTSLWSTKRAWWAPESWPVSSPARNDRTPR